MGGPCATPCLCPYDPCGQYPSDLEQGGTGTIGPSSEQWDWNHGRGTKVVEGHESDGAGKWWLMSQATSADHPRRQVTSTLGREFAQRAIPSWRAGRRALCRYGPSSDTELGPTRKWTVPSDRAVASLLIGASASRTLCATTSARRSRELDRGLEVVLSAYGLG